MNRLALLVSFIMVIGVLGFSAINSSAETVTLEGTIVDNMCADGHAESLGDFVETHPKSCALMDVCVASGYSVYSGGKRYLFDEESSMKIEKFLRKDTSTLNVKVKAEESRGGELRLLEIMNM